MQTLDILHASLPLTVAKLSTVKNSPVFRPPCTYTILFTKHVSAVLLLVPLYSTYLAFRHLGLMQLNLSAVPPAPLKLRPYKLVYYYYYSILLLRKLSFTSALRISALVRALRVCLLPPSGTHRVTAVASVL